MDRSPAIPSSVIINVLDADLIGFERVAYVMQRGDPAYQNVAFWIARVALFLNAFSREVRRLRHGTVPLPDARGTARRAR